MEDYFKKNTIFEKVYYDSDFVSKNDLTMKSIGYDVKSRIYKSYTDSTSYIQIYFEGMLVNHEHLAWRCLDGC